MASKNKGGIGYAGNLYMGIIDDPIRDDTELNYDDIDPVFSFKSAKVNLKYNKLIPFVGVYLIYKYLL
jgi:hypothetical protein